MSVSGDVMGWFKKRFREFHGFQKYFREFQGGLGASDAIWGFHGLSRGFNNVSLSFKEL